MAGSPGKCYPLSMANQRMTVNSNRSATGGPRGGVSGKVVEKSVASVLVQKPVTKHATITLTQANNAVRAYLAGTKTK